MGTTTWSHGIFEVAYLDNADFVRSSCFTRYRLCHDKGPVHKLCWYFEKKRLSETRSLTMGPREASISESKTTTMCYNCVPSKPLIGSHCITSLSNWYPNPLLYLAGGEPIPDIVPRMALRQQRAYLNGTLFPPSHAGRLT